MSVYDKLKAAIVRIHNLDVGCYTWAGWHFSQLGLTCLGTDIHNEYAIVRDANCRSLGQKLYSFHWDSSTFTRLEIEQDMTLPYGSNDCQAVARWGGREGGYTALKIVKWSGEAPSAMQYVHYEK